MNYTFDSSHRNILFFTDYVHSPAKLVRLVLKGLSSFDPRGGPPRLRHDTQQQYHSLQVVIVVVVEKVKKLSPSSNLEERAA